MVQFHSDITKVGQILKKFPPKASCASWNDFIMKNSCQSHTASLKLS